MSKKVLWTIKRRHYLQSLDMSAICHTSDLLELAAITFSTMENLQNILNNICLKPLHNFFSNYINTTFFLSSYNNLSNSIGFDDNRQGNL